MTSAVISVNDETFDAEVNGTPDIPVVVDFWAPWCAPCRRLAPLLEDIADEFMGHVLFASYNVAEGSEVAEELGVRTLPTLMVFKNGFRIAEHTGAISGARLREFIESYV